MYTDRNKIKRILISNDNIIINDKSIGVKIMRLDGVLLPKFEYFPRFKKTGEVLVEVIPESTYTTVKIPTWLYDKKILPGFQIAT